jgi:hypothetical protein
MKFRFDITFKTLSVSRERGALLVTYCQAFCDFLKKMVFLEHFRKTVYLIEAFFLLNFCNFLSCCRLFLSLFSCIHKYTISPYAYCTYKFGLGTSFFFICNCEFIASSTDDKPL